MGTRSGEPVKILATRPPLLRNTEVTFDLHLGAVTLQYRGAPSMLLLRVNARSELNFVFWTTIFSMLPGEGLT